ncbi:general secretion pathway protein GspB [Aliivibrio kagoshimensis]|uniref:general secretion pathway protein GspB n=1 Tax=Aliivibrio kagoshimensis TaxID=2910230 RepID=UPI003D114F4D
MSKILNALNHSEQQFKQQQSLEGMAGHYSFLEEKKSINLYLLFSLLVCVPAVVVMVIAIIINPMPAKQFIERYFSLNISNIVSVKSVIPVSQQASIVVAEASSGWLILDYPHFETQPLPKAQLIVSSDPLPSKKVVNVNVESVAERDESEVDLHQLDMSELSPEIAARLKSIMQNQSPQPTRQPVSDGPRLAEYGTIVLPRHSAEFVGKLPAMNFQTHIYASQADRRWVKVNGVEATEGDDIALGVRLLEIKPREVIVDFRGETLSIPSLYEWGG